MATEENVAAGVRFEDAENSDDRGAVAAGSGAIAGKNGAAVFKVTADEDAKGVQKRLETIQLELPT